MVFQKGKVLLAALFLVMGVMFLMATRDTAALIFADPYEMEVMTYPRFLIYGWLAVSLAYLFKPVENLDWWGLKNCWPTLLQVATTIALYICTFSRLGLMLSTFLFLMLFFHILDYREWKKSLPIAGLSAGLTWLIFVQILSVPLPRAAWITWLL